MEAPKHPLAVWREAQPKPLTQEALAKLVGTSRWTINSIETGRRKPSFAMMRKIVTATRGGVTKHDLREDVYGPAPRRRVAA